MASTSESADETGGATNATDGASNEVKSAVEGPRKPCNICIIDRIKKLEKQLLRIETQQVNFHAATKNRLMIVESTDGSFQQLHDVSTGDVIENFPLTVDEFDLLDGEQLDDVLKALGFQLRPDLTLTEKRNRLALEWLHMT